MTRRRLRTHPMRGRLAKIGVAALCLFFLMEAGAGRADHDDHGRQRGHSKHSQDGRRGDAAGNTSGGVFTPEPSYTEACGQCHFAYPPFLLPSASWMRILDGREDHFGNEVVLADADVETLRSYLAANSADRSRSKMSRRIVSSLSGNIVARVTQVPYIAAKHRDGDIPADAFRRESVGSMANCAACHPGAEQGAFDDDSVRIPD